MLLYCTFDIVTTVQHQVRIMIISTENLTNDSSRNEYSPVAMTKTNTSCDLPPNGSSKRRSSNNLSPRRKRPVHKQRPSNKTRTILSHEKKKKASSKTTPKASTAGKMWIRIVSPVNVESTTRQGRTSLTPYQGIRIDAPSHPHSSPSSSLEHTTDQSQVRFPPNLVQHKPPTISFGESGRLLRPIVGTSCYLPRPSRGVQRFLLKY